LSLGNVSHRNISPQIDPPFFLHQFGNDLECGPPIGPLEHLHGLGGVRTEFLRVGHHSHSAQVKAIRVPARLDRNVRIGQAIGVVGAGFVEKLEVGIGKVEKIATEFGGEFSPTLAMPEVHDLVDAPRIVENGEEFDDLDIGPVVFANRSPFSRTLAQWETPWVPWQGSA
jgi:hypothetical protein